MKAVFALLVLFAALLVTVSARPVADTVKASNFDCDTCQFMVGYIEGYLNESATVGEIINYLEAICALAPSSSQAECKAFVANEVPVLIAYLLRNENPDTVCPQVGLCANTLAQPEQIGLIKIFSRNINI
jgi:hypothetical protein